MQESWTELRTIASIVCNCVAFIWPGLCFGVWKRPARPQKRAPSWLQISTKEASHFKTIKTMNPSLLKTESIIFLSQQGTLISLNIYYFGTICLQLQAVKSSCYPPPPHPNFVCSGCLLRTSLKGVFLGHQDGLLKLLFIPPRKKKLSIGRLLGRLAGYVQDCVKTGRGVHRVYPKIF